MSWDAFQREVLGELGHVLYRAVAPAPELPAPVLDEPPVVSNAPATPADAALMSRLARAAGVPIDAIPAALRDPAQLSRLRADPAAKRALWARLRGMRARPQ